MNPHQPTDFQIWIRTENRQRKVAVNGSATCLLVAPPVIFIFLLLF